MNANKHARTSAITILLEISCVDQTPIIARKLNPRENKIAATRPVSAVIHEPQSVTSDLQASVGVSPSGLCSIQVLTRVSIFNPLPLSI